MCRVDMANLGANELMPLTSNAGPAWLHPGCLCHEGAICKRRHLDIVKAFCVDRTTKIDAVTIASLQQAKLTSAGRDRHVPEATGILRLWRLRRDSGHAAAAFEQLGHPPQCKRQWLCQAPEGLAELTSGTTAPNGGQGVDHGDDQQRERRTGQPLHVAAFDPARPSSRLVKTLQRITLTHCCRKEMWQAY